MEEEEETAEEGEMAVVAVIDGEESFAALPRTRVRY